MTEEKLNSLFSDEKIGTRVFNRVGLRNINQRIRLHFGDVYGLSVNSVLGEGTEVKILIPAIREDIVHV